MIDLEQIKQAQNKGNQQPKSSGGKGMNLSLKKSQVIKTSDLQTVSVIWLWIAAGILVAISTLGQIVQFNGGWEYFIIGTEETGQAIAWGIAFQAFCFVSQWAFKAKGMTILYMVFLLVSVIPSFLSYYTLTADYFTIVFQFRGWFNFNQSISGVLAFLFIFIVCFLIDLMPEWILVS